MEELDEFDFKEKYLGKAVFYADQECTVVGYGHISINDYADEYGNEDIDSIKTVNSQLRDRVINALIVTPYKHIKYWGWENDQLEEDVDVIFEEKAFLGSILYMHLEDISDYKFK